jgi:hypothetical protein
MDSTAATTTFTVLALLSGHNQGHRCVAGAAGKHQHRCTRRVAVGSFRHADVGGNIRVKFTGRVHGGKLAPGRYLLVLTPTADGMVGRAVTLAFRIVA